MKKVLLFGSTGHLGKMIAAELVNQGYDVTAVVRNQARQSVVKSLVQQSLVADVLQSTALAGICEGFEIVVSALGKPVSPNNWSKTTFRQVDLEANSTILQQAVKSGIKKFVYVSAFQAENYPHLEYFKVHHEFSLRLKASGLDYAIIKPPAIFSAYLDLIEMAKKGQLVTLGNGDKRTNAIYEGDLAKICVAAIQQPSAEIEAGGREVLTRHETNVLIQQMVNPSKKVRKVPLGIVNTFLPLARIFSPNLYEKLAFFTAVMQHDVIAPPVGETTLAWYIQMKTAKKAESLLT